MQGDERIAWLASIRQSNDLRNGNACLPALGKVTAIDGFHLFLNSDSPLKSALCKKKFPVISNL
jgi:hypothetical protein